MSRLLYNKKNAAIQLSISPRSIGYLIAEGKIGTRKIGKRILIPHSELVRFAKADHFAPICPKISDRDATTKMG